MPGCDMSCNLKAKATSVAAELPASSFCQAVTMPIAIGHMLLLRATVPKTGEGQHAVSAIESIC